MKSGQALSLRMYATREGRVPFREWLEGLDQTARNRIDARLTRVGEGNLGDHREIGEGLHELRLFSGPGYRVYFAWDGDALIILFVGGTKGTQRRDIHRAHEYHQDYLERRHASDR